VHLEEFAAHECIKYDHNLDMNVLARQKPFRSTQPSATNDVESNSSDDDKEGRNRRVEDLGGGAESDDDVVNDTDGDVSQLAAKNPRKLYNLAACQTLLRRTKEIDSINQQGAGMRKENHVQMRSYAEIFASLLDEDLPAVSKTSCAAHLQTQHNSSTARTVQNCIATDLRSKEFGTSDTKKQVMSCPSKWPWPSWRR